MSVYKKTYAYLPENEAKFDSFINKTIILSSKKYFKKEITAFNREKEFLDDDISYSFSLIFYPNSMSEVDSSLDLNNALKSLSAIEQSVIFLLYKEELSHEDAARILEICSNSVSRIKARAISKLKKYFKGDLEDE